MLSCITPLLNRIQARALLLVFFSFLLAFYSRGQQIRPITAAVQLVPPYSVYLPDYAAPGADKLRVILTLNDISQPSYRVKLQLKVELNGRVVLQTDPTYQPSPIELLPGQPVIISGAQLSDYLSTRHLQFLNGFNREQYERTKALPEGVYRLCFTAYDYIRADKPVSNEGCNVFFFKKSEPPLLNLPFHRSRVERKDPQFLTFSWSSRNTPSLPTASGGTAYRLELFEVRPKGSNAEYIVRSAKPIYSTTTEGMTLVYGPAEPLLQDSMEYVWRVQAYDREGRDAYQNNGYSNTSVFTYGGEDPFAVNHIGRPTLTGEALSERSGRWSWHTSNGHKVEGWKLQYRKQSTNNDQPSTPFEWNTKETTDTLLNLFNLEADNPYEARVQARVGGLYGPWSEVVVFRTLPKRVFECGQEYEQLSVQNGQPLQAATPGMLVQVGQFQMELLKVEGANGFFSGYGAIATPLLGFRLHVKFTNIGINDQLVLTSGEVVAISEGIPDWLREHTTNEPEESAGGKDWTEPLPDMDTASLETLKDFAAAVLKLDDSTWTDTAVFTAAESEEIKGYLADVKAAMADLNDSDSTNNGAAETKLRKTLKAAQPLLEKLSANISKGGVGRLGVIREELYTGLIDAHIQVLEQGSSSGGSTSVTGDRGPQISIDAWLDERPTCWDSYPAAKKAAILAFLEKHRRDEKLFTGFLQELDGAIQQEAAIRTSIEQLEQYVGQWRKDHPGETKSAKQIVESLEAWIGANRDHLCGVIDRLWQRAKLAGQFSDEHPPVRRRISKAAADQLWSGGLSQWLNQHGVPAKVYLHRVDQSEVAIRQAGGNTALSRDAAAQQFDNGTFSQHVAIWVEYNEDTGEMEVYLKYRHGYLRPGQYANGRSGDWFAHQIIDRLNRKLARSSWEQPLVQKQEINSGADGRYRTSELNVLQWAAFGLEELGHVVNQAEVSAYLWNDQSDKAAYDRSLMNFWAPIAAGGDQGLAEVKDLYELVNFTGDLIEKPSLVKDIYQSVTSLSYEDIRGLIQKGIDEKKAIYQVPGTVRQYHTTRDGIQAMMIVAGAAKSLPALIKKGGGYLQSLKKLLKEIPHADVQGKIKNLSEEFAAKFVDDFGNASTNLLKRLKEDPFVFDDWYGSIQSGFKRINVKGRLDQIGEYAIESVNGVKLKWKNLNGKVDFGERKDLRKVLNLTDDGMEAHHKLPWKICENNRVVQEAAKDGFHPNMIENGISLTKYKAGEIDEIGLHANHPKYDEWVNKRLSEWSASKGNRFTSEEANLFIHKELIPDLDELINAAKSSNKNLNDFFRDLL